jgi:hypothetical protein
VSYFCNPCRKVIPDGKRCEHWSIEDALAGNYCSCGRQGLAPGWDYHCMECHKDFTRVDSTGATVGDREGFYAHEHGALKPKRAKARA